MDFKLPDIGEGVHEGEITKWLVQAGQTVAADQPMVEVMTDKATVEIPAPVGGTVEELFAKEGETVLVGKVILRIAEQGKAAAKPAEAAAPKAPPAGAVASPQSLDLSLRQAVAEAWAQVDTQLQRRNDLIPNLVETVKGYMGHERGTLEAVTQARAAAQSANTVGEKAAADGAKPEFPARARPGLPEPPRHCAPTTGRCRACSAASPPARCPATTLGQTPAGCVCTARTRAAPCGRPRS